MNRKSNQGFTLIEVMVALLISAMAVSALLVRMMSYVDNTGYLRDKSIAQWVALNQLELERLANQQSNNLLDREKTGVEEMAGRQWHWKITPNKTANEGFVELQVAVFSDPDQENQLISFSGYIDKFHRSSTQQAAP